MNNKEDQSLNIPTLTIGIIVMLIVIGIPYAFIATCFMLMIFGS